MNQDMQYRILIVDDEEIFREELKEYLGYERPNWIIVLAKDGVHALELLQEDTNFNAALIDLRMPRMRGEVLLEDMVEQYPDICPIILTAYGDIPKAVLSTKIGAYDFLTKPIDPDTLISTIEEGIAFHRMSSLAQYILTKLNTEEVFDAVIQIATLRFRLGGYSLAK